MTLYVQIMRQVEHVTNKLEQDVWSGIKSGIIRLTAEMQVYLYVPISFIKDKLERVQMFFQKSEACY